MNKLLLPFASFAFFIVVALAITRCDFRSGDRPNEFWTKLSRRLFDEDMPKEADKTKRSYDMTDIGSSEGK